MARRGGAANPFIGAMQELITRRDLDARNNVERAITPSGQVVAEQIVGAISGSSAPVTYAESVVVEPNAVSTATNLATQLTVIVTQILSHLHDDRYYTETESNALYSLVGHTHVGGGAPDYLYSPDGTDPDWLTDADGHAVRWSA